MPGEDLTLRTVLEAVLDAKGFEEFKAKVEEAAATTQKVSAGAEASGGHFDKLGKKLPNAAFDILSREMLRNAGVQEGLGPLTRVSTAALESLAAAGKLTSTSLAGITFGLSLLIPLIALFLTKSNETADATATVTDNTDSLIAVYEKLQQKTGHLTKAQSDYLGVLKQLQVEERQQAEDAIQKQIKAQDDLIRSTLSLWGATKIATKQWFEYFTQGKAFLSLSDEMARRTDEARAKQQQLGAQLEVLRAAHKAGFKSAEEQGQAELDAAQKAEEGAKRAADAAKKVAEFRLQLNQRMEQELAALAIERAENVFDKEKAIAAQEAILLKNEIANAKKLGATRAEEDRLREVSHTRLITRISAEEKKFAREREKQIEDGIRKNKEEANAVLANLEDIRRMKEEEQRAEEERDAANTERIQASAQAATLLFGKNKGIAIAAAMIDTYAAANAALKHPPGPPSSIPFMLLAIATGLKNVQQIQSASPGGFDDPTNDAMVNTAFKDVGRRWATDMVGLAKEGFLTGLGDKAGGRGTVIHQSTRIDRGTHIGTAQFNGLLGTPGQAMLDFERRRIRVARREDRTRRRSTS